MSTTTAKQGAGFLLHDIDVDSLSTPERLTDEQRMMRDTVRKFVQTELQPNLPELEKLNPELLREMLQKAAELGFCMIDIPEEYDGLGLDFLSSIQPTELLNWGGGFGTCHSVQTVIGMLPILYFGDEAMKQKYLPKIATAELVSAYALTEPGSGSDALAAKTTAVLEGDEWVLNGTKQFITNGSIADIFIVFAQVDGNAFSAFVVEKGEAGFEIGAEEHKMGIKSSSTTSLAFDNCRIPKDRLIGEVGWGGKIALNVLNVGRLKLGVAAVGGSKEALQLSAQYAKERHQFGTAIANFGLMQEKLAEMASRTYAAESCVLRTAGLAAEAVHSAKDAAGGEGNIGEVMMGALREFNVECCMDKVHGSETLAYCVDEGVQIHGGYGFIEEYTIARLYRDARISRLYEGTNEINRMQIAGDILKRAAKGELKFDSSAGQGGDKDFGELNDVAQQLRDAKKGLAALIQLFAETAGGKVDKRAADQELLQRIADIVTGIYATETAMGRALAARADGYEGAEAFELMTKVYAVYAGQGAQKSAREALGLLKDKGAGEESMQQIESLLTAPMRNVIALRRGVAKIMLDRDGVWFNDEG